MRSHVDSHTGPHEPVDGDFVYVPTTLEEMNGSVEVGSPMFGSAETVSLVVVAPRLDSRIAALEGEALFRRPINGGFIERVCEVDDGAIAR